MLARLIHVMPLLYSIMLSCDPTLTAFDHQAGAYYWTGPNWQRAVTLGTSPDLLTRQETRGALSPDLRINQHCAPLLHHRHLLRRFSGGITEEAAERLNSYRFTSSHLWLARGALVTSGTSAVWPWQYHYARFRRVASTTVGDDVFYYAGDAPYLNPFFFFLFLMLSWE